MISVHTMQCWQKSTLYSKTLYRLPMKNELYDTFRILEEKGHFWPPMNGTSKDDTPMQESAYRGPKIGFFLYFSIFIAIGVSFFVV